MATVKRYKGFHMIHLGKKLYQVNCPDGVKFRYGFHKKLMSKIEISKAEAKFIDKIEIESDLSEPRNGIRTNKKKSKIEFHFIEYIKSRGWI